MAAWKHITVRTNLYSRLDGHLRCAKCGQTLSIGTKRGHTCAHEKGNRAPSTIALFVSQSFGFKGGSEDSE